MKGKLDILIKNAEELLTLDSTLSGPRRGKQMGELGIIQRGALGIKDEKIVSVGTIDQILKETEINEKTEIIDASGKVVTPGLVDPHTHLVFAGTREDEFEERISGKTYQEIEARGGGIRATVKKVRQSTKEELVELALTRLERMLKQGTTTVEVKSGYGLNLNDEFKILEAVRDLNHIQPVELIPTFLGAHQIPDEFKEERTDYIELLIEEMIPQVAERRLAEFCDVFCEDGAFTDEESKEILSTGKKAGLIPKIHADELSPYGGAELAAQVGAISADHLVYASLEGIRKMRESGVIAVLLPGTSFFLNSERYAPARKMIQEGLPVALATDFNPGSCMTESMPLIINLACLKMGLTPAEAIVAATINAAYAIGREEKIGSFQRGKIADVVIWDFPRYRILPYHFGVTLAETVIKKGKVLIERGNKR